MNEVYQHTDALPTFKNLDVEELKPRFENLGSKISIEKFPSSEEMQRQIEILSRPEGPREYSNNWVAPEKPYPRGQTSVSFHMDELGYVLENKQKGLLWI